MIPTLTLLLLPALQQPAPAPVPSAERPAAQQPAGRRGKDYKNLSDSEYYRALQIVQQEAVRRGDTELASALGARLAGMESPTGGRARDRAHSRNRAKDTRSDKRNRAGRATDSARDSAGEVVTDDGSGRFGKGRRRSNLEGKESKEARMDALQRQIDMLEKELQKRREEMARLQAQPDTQVQQKQPPAGGRRTGRVGRGRGGE